MDRLTEIQKEVALKHGAEIATNTGRESVSIQWNTADKKYEWDEDGPWEFWCVDEKAGEEWLIPVFISQEDGNVYGVWHDGELHPMMPPY